MDGYNKLGAGVQSLITTPLITKRNEALSNYYSQLEERANTDFGKQFVEQVETNNKIELEKEEMANKEKARNETNEARKSKFNDYKSKLSNDRNNEINKMKTEFDADNKAYRNLLGRVDNILNYKKFANKFNNGGVE